MKCSWKARARGARGAAPQLLPSKLPGAQQAPTLPLSEAGTSKPPSRIILSFLSITAALHESGLGMPGWRAVWSPLSLPATLLLAGALVLT